MRGVVLLEKGLDTAAPGDVDEARRPGPIKRPIGREDAGEDGQSHHARPFDAGEPEAGGRRSAIVEEAAAERAPV